MMTKLSHVLFMVVVVLLLVACGNSDSSTAQENDNATPQPPSKPPFLIDGDNVDAFGAVALNLPEGMLQFGHYSHTLMLQNEIPFDTLQFCGNGGTRTLTLNQPTPITSGSVIKDILEDCFVTELNAYLRGTVTLSVNDHTFEDDVHSYSLALDLTQVSFREFPSLRVLDSVNIALTLEKMQRTIEVQPSDNQVRFNFSDGDRYTLSDFSLTSLIDLSTAKYHVDYHGQIALNHFTNYLTVATTEPLEGYLGEYPFNFYVQLSDSENNRLRLSPNQVAGDNRLSIQFNQRTRELHRWMLLTEGTYWSWPGKYDRMNANIFHEDNFHYVGVIDSPSFSDFPSMGTITLLFSRPIAAVERFNNSDYFASSRSTLFPSVPADERFEGALFRATPRSALLPGFVYNTSGRIIRNSAGASAYYGSPSNINVSSAIEAKIYTEQVSVVPGMELALSGANSIIADELSASYNWQELTDFGVQFSSTDTQETTLHIPTDLTSGVIRIRLLVEDELGRSDASDLKLLVFDKSMPVFYFDSEPGELMGGGRTRFLTKEIGTLDISGPDRNSLYVTFRSAENNSEAWSFNISAPEGEDLAVGLYNNAVQMSTKSPHQNGMNFSKQGWRCSILDGHFEIFELELFETINEWGTPILAASTFSANFYQSCSDTEAGVSGKVRLNSDYPI